MQDHPVTYFIVTNSGFQSFYPQPRNKNGWLEQYDAFLGPEVRWGSRECPSLNQAPGRQIDNLYPLYLCIFTKPGAGEIAARFFIFGNNVGPQGTRSPFDIW